MEFHVPQNSSTASDGDSLDEWEQVEYDSKNKSQKKQLNTFAQILADISKKTKEIDEKVAVVEGIRAQAVKTLKEIEDTKSLVYFGFFALLLVVIGIAFGYWNSLSQGIANNDNVFHLMEKINENENEIIGINHELNALNNVSTSTGLIQK